MLPGDTAKHLLPHLTFLRLSVLRLTSVACPVPCICFINCLLLYCFSHKNSISILYIFHNFALVSLCIFFKTDKKSCLPIPENYHLRKHHSINLPGVVQDTPDTSKSPAYCFAQLKQGTCLIRLKNKRNLTYRISKNIHC